MKPTKEPTRKTGRPLSFDRDQALQKAMLAFWRHGYETTSISDLTAAMGITAPSLYTAYGDKRQLFLEAVKLYAGSPDELERGLYAAATAGEAARAMLASAAMAYTGEHTPRGCLMASATASGSKDATDVQNAVADIRRDIGDRLARRILKDVSDGVLPPETDNRSLAAMVMAVIQGMSVLARDGMDRAALLALVETAMLAWPAQNLPDRP